jgi:hypothetical protein
MMAWPEAARNGRRAENSLNPWALEFSAVPRSLPFRETF